MVGHPTTLSSMLRCAALMLGLGSLAGCGTTAATGHCRDYQPLDMCPTGTRYHCETTQEGCRWCDCVPIEDQTVGPPEPSGN